MLLEATIGNCLSYNDPQTFSLVASNADEHEHSNVAAVQAANKHRLLRTAVIYGPNASGKSNLLHGLLAMRNIIVQSAASQRGDALPVTPFKLDHQKRHAPTEFEVVFIAEKVRYQYGFTATKDKVHEEWLFAFPKGQAQTWFQRVWDEEQQDYHWNFGSNLQGEKAVWRRSTRNNALFLSTAVQLNSLQLQPVFDWFSNTLKFIGVDKIPSKYTAMKVHKGGKAEVLNYLNSVGINLADIAVTEVPVSETLPPDIPAKLRERIAQDLKNQAHLDVKVQRLDDQNELVDFSFETEESEGTQRFFSLVGPWIDVLEQGAVLFVDELNNSLHTNLVLFLLKLFNNPVTNPKNAQLVFTTHDTNQLNKNVLRRDQIWFCEKNSAQATELYALSDFKVRKGREDFELAYLSGRFGALPFIKEFGVANEREE